MSSIVQFPRKVNVEKLVLGDEAKPMKVTGLFNIPFSYNGENSLIIQTPKMKAPFGITEGMNNNGKFSIELSFDGEKGETKDAKRMVELKTCMQSLNAKLVETCFKHPEWLKLKNNKNKSCESYCDEYLASSIRPPKEEFKDKYADRFKISIPFDSRTGKSSDYVEFYNQDKKRISWDDVSGMKGFSAMCLYKISGAWVSPSLKKFGYFIKLVQMQLFPNETIRGLSMLKYGSDSDSDNESEDEDDGLDEEVDSDVQDVEE
jgi:hypothetical protein